MQRLFGKSIKSLNKFKKDTEGAVLVYTALGMSVMLGVAGLSTDVALWYGEKRVAQSVADAAAMAAALEFDRSDSTHKLRVAAGNSAVSNGYDPAQGDDLEINNPPLSGPNAGNPDFIEVVFRRDSPLFFSAMVLDGDSPVRVVGRAVSTIAPEDNCIWSLNPTERGAITVGGNADVTLGCGMLVNSNDSEALKQNGASCIDAESVSVVGGASGRCIEPTPTEGASPVSDPMAWMTPPDYEACTDLTPISVTNGQTRHIAPGTHCGDISISSGGTIIFEPGLHVLDGAALNFNGGTVMGEDVTFYITENSTATDNITINAQASVSLSAPENGAYPNVLFYQDRNAPEGISHRINGGATLDLVGILYFPGQHVTFAGGASSNLSQTILIADTLKFTGASSFGGGDDDDEGGRSLMTKVTLVE